MPKSFRPWQPEQITLLPPSPSDWLSDDHQVYFLLDLVDELISSSILIPAQSKDPRGEKGFVLRDDDVAAALRLLRGHRLLPQDQSAPAHEDLAFRVLTGRTGSLRPQPHQRVPTSQHLDALSDLVRSASCGCVRRPGMAEPRPCLAWMAPRCRPMPGAQGHEPRADAQSREAAGEGDQRLDAPRRILDAQEDRRYGKGTAAVTCRMNCGAGRTAWPGSARPARKWKRKPQLQQRVNGTRKQKRPGPKPLPPRNRMHRQLSRPI